MEYVELLRGRRILLWYGLAVVSIAVIALLSAHGHVHLDGATGKELLSSILVGCGLVAMIVAAFAATGIPAEHATVPLLWTRPARRDAMAWRYVAVDLGVIATAYAITVVVLAASLAVVGMWQRYVVVDPGRSASAVALALAASFLYYALVALVAVRIPSRAPAVAGLSWVVFSAIGSLGAFPLPPVLHAVTRVLKIVDPFAYLSMRGDHVQVVISTTSAADAWIPTLPLIPRAGLAAAIAAVALVAMVRLWSTREVTA